MPNPDELCVISVAGTSYQDFETIWVRAEYGANFRTFRVTASENSDNLPTMFSQIKVTPGDEFTMTLGGLTAIVGWVYETQRYYDANRHGLLIAGRSLAADSTKNAVMKPGGEFKNYSIKSIIDSVLQGAGFGVEYKGNAAAASQPMKERVQVYPGESQFELIERILRMKGGIIGDNAQGNMVLHFPSPITGALSGSITGELVEGQNILSARATVRDIQIATMGAAMTQKPGNDKEHGPMTNDLAWIVGNNWSGRGRMSPIAFISEMATDLQTLKQRLAFEMAWRASEAILVEITVQGWKTQAGELWEPMNTALVNSPMLLLSEALIIKAVTFLQDATGGTRTIIELVNQLALSQEFGASMNPAGDGSSEG